MIISEPKPLPDILQSLDGTKTVTIVGCGTCATQCHAGGEEEVQKMRCKLEKLGKIVPLSFVLESVCTTQKTKKELMNKGNFIEEADAILVMSCGVGVQTVAELTEKPVFPALNTLFIGSLKRVGHYQELCSLCGECILEYTGGVCPINLCSKGLLNGPCGGSSQGKCEVRADRDCGWYLVYERLKQRGKLNLMEKIHQPQDFSQGQHPQKITLDREMLRKKSDRRRSRKPQRAIQK
jgi:ferredoxin